MVNAYSARPRCKALLLGALILAPSVGESQSPPCPRPALARFAALAGRRSVDWRYLIDGELRAVEGATATIDIVGGGCAVRERLEGNLGGTQLAVATLIGDSSATRPPRLHGRGTGKPGDRDLHVAQWWSRMGLGPTRPVSPVAGVRGPRP